MKNILNFLVETGKLKGKERRGWQLHGIKNSETTAEHIFYLTIMTWIVGKRKRLNIERVLKLALVHDLCEVYAPDLTPYDPLLPKDKKKIAEALKRWPKFTNSLRIKKDKKKNEMENKAINRLVADLPTSLKSEIKAIWLDFSKGLSKEARFVRQADKAVNFLQGMEYWKKHGKIQHKLWNRWIKEIIDDPALIELIKAIEKKFY